MAECARPRVQRRKKGENSGNSRHACLVDMAAPEDGRTPPPSLRPCMNALILVDIQNDFVPGGALPVPAGDQIIPVVNRLQPHFDIVVATQDWHPANHGSFAASHPGKQPGDIIELNSLPKSFGPSTAFSTPPARPWFPASTPPPLPRSSKRAPTPASTVTAASSTTVTGTQPVWRIF